MPEPTHIGIVDELSSGLNLLYAMLFLNIWKDIHNVSVYKKIYPMVGNILDTEFWCFSML